MNKRFIVIAVFLGIVITVAFFIGCPNKAMEFGEYLFKNGIFAQPIRYPTVSHNHARIRISITARLTDDHIIKSLSVLESAKRKFHLI